MTVLSQSDKKNKLDENSLNKLRENYELALARNQKTNAAFIFSLTDRSCIDSHPYPCQDDPRCNVELEDLRKVMRERMLCIAESQVCPTKECSLLGGQYIESYSTAAFVCSLDLESALKILERSDVATIELADIVEVDP
ncbi:MAG: hypothetical protein WC966_06295 [Bradymonadales bacterium]|jgi:hypothetical protein